MANQKHKEGIDRYVIRVISRKANELIGRSGFTESDREDIKQEILVELLQRIPKYDSQRGRRNTLTAHIINHAVANILNARNAEKRDFRRTVPLDDMTVDGEISEIEDNEDESAKGADAIDLEEYLLRTGKKSRSVADLRDIRMDIQRLMRNLPPYLQDLCKRLHSQTVSQIARETGKSRAAVYLSIKLLKRFFEDAGLQDYL